MSNKCKICGRSCYDYQKLKSGIICSDCLNTLPLGVKNCIREFTGDQIQKIQKVAKPFDGKSKIWRYCEDLKVCVDSIVLNKMEYKFKDLESVKLNFHPKEIGKMPDTAEGIVTVVIEIKSPHVLIEEAFLSKRITAKYIISGLDIIYHYNQELEYTIHAVQEAIRNKTYVIKDAYNREEKETNDSKKSSANNSRSKDNKSSYTAKATPLESAMELFSVKRPFTKAELRKKRNIFLASNHVHPDDGGSEEAFRKVQDAYELLMKFASD